MRRPLMRQLGHELYEVCFAVASICSRFINARFYGGSMYQTLSARTYMEAHPSWMSPEDANTSLYVIKWRKRERRINFLLRFLGPDHCKVSRDEDVLRMRRGLHRYGEGPNPE